MISGIFYARFLAKEGPRIVAQSPPNLLGPPKTSLLDFDHLQPYIIPRKPFCNRVVTVTDAEGKYVIVSHPVLISHEKYPRNEFMFNFGVVVEEGGDRGTFEGIVRRLAVTFGEMEVQDMYLSSQEDMGEGADIGRVGKGKEREREREKVTGRRGVEGLLEIVREDLNNYGECMIPVDEANTINMKLFPHYRPPPEVKPWHVPVAKLKLSEIVDPTWDLTMQKIIPHIDGASDVRRIAHTASVSLPLAQSAIRHLLYYDAVLLLDIFFFGSCYAPRPGITDFVANVGGMADECAGYACIHSRQRLSNYHLARLMTTFCVGRSVAEWLRFHREAGLDVLRYIDVRRFVQFGVIKGCLYRVHKYVVSKQYIAALATGQAAPREGGDDLQRYTDGAHCFDEIVTQMNLTDEEVTGKLKDLGLKLPAGDMTVFYR
ncbi:related to nitrogen permease regulator [Cephalotrichum gorgonifer]|uniref:Related to nitrogen permease regulator n=1 Tax=Cephalotrichum gorgonifer TaxID=2041049 RepID=A0AAE8SVR2_9PEZI|nr:related to nitrogen permease regulator [Cephalotrichum gorgonifer]